MARQLKVALKVQRRNDRRGHYLSIAHLALQIFIMVKGFEHIVTQAKHCSNLAVHAMLLAELWFSHRQLYQNSHGYFYLLTTRWQLGLITLDPQVRRR
jgi:hypothetical protein